MKSIRILLIEDNEGDILLTREAFEERNVVNEMDVVRDGQEALDYLNTALQNVNNQLPDLILLDVNLPKMNGHEVLAAIKNSEELKHLPIIMLTTSSSESDILSSYKNHANCYITKPVDVGDFMEAVSTIEDFWFNIVKRPKFL